MVKKAKKVAKASKITKTAKKPAAASSKHVEIPVHSVIQFARMLHEKEHADSFVAKAKASKAVIKMDTHSVRLVKDYLANNQLRGAVAKSVDDPCPGDPFDCKLG